jgi:hypothetical protein
MDGGVAAALIAGAVALSSASAAALTSRKSVAVVELEKALEWQRAEIVELRSQVAELPELRAQLRQANAHIDALAEELAVLRKDRP